MIATRIRLSAGVRLHRQQIRERMKSHGGPPRPPRRPGQDPWGDGDDESSGKKYEFWFLDVVQDLAISLLVTSSISSAPFIGMLCSNGFIWISGVCTEAISWLAYRPIP